MELCALDVHGCLNLMELCALDVHGYLDLMELCALGLHAVTGQAPDGVGQRPDDDPRCRAGYHPWHLVQSPCRPIFPLSYHISVYVR